MRLIDAEQIGLTDMEIIMCDGNYKKAVEILINKIANAPSIDAVNHTADYDEKNDILFVHLSPDNSNSYGEEIDKNIIIMRDMDSNEITGVMLYGFNKYVKHGIWIEENTRPRSSQFYCSVCHRTAYDPQPTRRDGWVKRCRYAYCPNCGADMRGEQDGREG